MRPRLKIRWTRTEKWLEVISLPGLVTPLLLAGYFWNQLPPRIPVHYNFVGKVDAYGARWTLLPLLGVHVLLWLSITIISRYPHLFNYPVEITPANASRQYRMARLLIIFLKTVLAWMFTGITLHIVLTALGDSFAVWPVVVIPLPLIVGGTVVYFVYALRQASS